jgi:PAS domain S-box-containing protein
LTLWRRAMEIIKFSVASKEVTVHLRQALNTLTERGKNLLEKTQRLQEARRARVNHLRELLASSLDAIVVTNGKIIKFSSQFVASKEVTVHLRQALNTLTERGKNLLEKTQRLQEARRARVNHLRKLLVHSADAIVVTNGDGRLVYANPKALDLFGVSELNMRKFTIDTFLSHCQILELRLKWFVIRRDERYGKCKISRLDGSLRVAQYILVANVIPRRCLYIFLNVARPGITQWLSVFRIGVRESGLQIGMLPPTPRANRRVEGTTITHSAFCSSDAGIPLPSPKFWHG